MVAPWSVRSQRVVRGLGVAAVVSVAATVWLGLWVTPPDAVQHNLVRLVYVHPPIVWVSLYLAFGIAAVSSVLWLWPRTRSPFWDRLAASSVEVGTVFTALDARHRLDLGPPHLGRVVGLGRAPHVDGVAPGAVARVPGGAARAAAAPDARARRCAVVALVAAVDVPIVHFSVDWWHTLHQNATVLNANLSPTIHGAMAWTLLLGFVAFTLVFAWMLAVRYRIEVLAEGALAAQFDLALHERWAEGDDSPSPEVGP